MAWSISATVDLPLVPVTPMMVSFLAGSPYQSAVQSAHAKW
jgi:hypothetical protein